MCPSTKGSTDVVLAENASPDASNSERQHELSDIRSGEHRVGQSFVRQSAPSSESPAGSASKTSTSAG